MMASSRDYLPGRSLPLAYFAGAHLAFGLACITLVVQPELPGAFHLHPRLVALLHLVTVGWISGSILGALYIVAPLAFGVPLRPGALDVMACVAFWSGVCGMVWGFWRADYHGVAHASVLVLGAMAFIGGRVAWGLKRGRLPSGVSLHVVLSFANVIIAGLVGAVLALHYVFGLLPWAPLPVAYAHGHLAVLGWATMMFFGVAYRLIPMFLPAAMPTGWPLAVSAILLEVGTIGLAVSLVTGASLVPWTVIILAAFMSFFRQVRGLLSHRRPRPVELPARDWSTWQTHVAMLCLMIAGALGSWLVAASPPAHVTWAYGFAGIVGFLSQAIVGIQGRLLPLQAWYRSMAGGSLPAMSVHRLAEPRLARAVLVLWVVGLPLVAAGLVDQHHTAIRVGATALAVATLVNGWHAALMVRRTKAPVSVKI
jgi:hypothetical protein